MSAAHPPAGMTQLSKEEFFEALAGAPGDPMPTTKYRDHTTWETRNGLIWGWSTGRSNISSDTVYAAYVKRSAS